MDIDKILNEYEADQARKKRESEEQIKAVEDRNTKERIRREGNAEAVENHLKSVVEPVFLEAATKLAAKSLAFEVSEIKRVDSMFAGQKTFCIGLTLKHGGVVNKSRLTFEGEFESVTLQISQSIGTERAISEPRMALSEVTKNYVEQRTEAFIRGVLGLK